MVPHAAEQTMGTQLCLVHFALPNARAMPASASDGVSRIIFQASAQLIRKMANIHHGRHNTIRTFTSVYLQLTTTGQIRTSSTLPLIILSLRTNSKTRSGSNSFRSSTRLHHLAISHSQMSVLSVAAQLLWQVAATLGATKGYVTELTHMSAQRQDVTRHFVLTISGHISKIANRPRNPLYS